MNVQIIIILIIFLVILALVWANPGPIIGSGEDVFGEWFPIISDSARGPKMVKYDDEVWDTQTDQYKPPSSDLQIATVITRGQAQHRKAIIALLMKALKKPRSIAEKLTALRSIIFGPSGSEPLKDSQIYTELCKHFSYNKDARDTNRAADILRHLAPFRAQIGPIKSYLDVGCGDAGITQDLSKGLGDPETHCVEVWKPENAPESVKYHVLDENAGETGLPLPYTAGQFDFISAIVSLHHVKYLGTMAAEIGRVLRPGGYLYLKEHDCWDAMDAMLVDIEHGIYIKCFNEGGTDGFPEGYLHHYKNIEGWKALLEGVGLEYVTHQYYNWGPKDEIGPTRIFWGLWRRKAQK